MHFAYYEWGVFDIDTISAKDSNSPGAVELRQACFSLPLHSRTSPDMVCNHFLRFIALSRLMS